MISLSLSRSLALILMHVINTTMLISLIVLAFFGAVVILRVAAYACTVDGKDAIRISCVT